MFYLQFGAGQAFANPLGGNLAGAVTGTTATTMPVRFLTLQDIDITIDQTLKELKGQYKFPDDVAPADMKITGKVGSGRFSLDALNQLAFADVYTAGETVVQAAALLTVPSTSPYTITITPPGSGVFSLDLGVQYFSTGQPLQKETSVSAIGQYSVSSGTYTFYSGDASAQVLISYTYTLTGGHTLTVNNQLMGYGPVWELWLAEPYQGNNGVHLYNARFSKMGLPIKRDDYLITDFEFEAYPNAAGQVLQFFTAL
jgi:hypothetical protein